MTQTPTDESMPAGWGPVSAGVQERAQATAIAAITYASTPAVNGTVPLARYYDVEANYAGVTFAALAPADPYDITATDLHAVRLLSVDVGAAATRRLLDDGPLRTEVLETLATVPTDVTLADATASTLEAMAIFYEATRRAMREPRAKASDPWVTTTKLTARKRPHLIPVRDTLVRKVLGLARLRDYRVEWLVLRDLVNDPVVTSALAAAVGRAQDAGRRQGRSMAFDTSVLRLLDVALWEYASATLEESDNSM